MEVVNFAKSVDSSAKGLCSVILGHALRKMALRQPRRVTEDK
jgi:hypothetical protein